MGSKEEEIIPVKEQNRVNLGELVQGLVESTDHLKKNWVITLSNRYRTGQVSESNKTVHF